MFISTAKFSTLASVIKWWLWKFCRSPLSAILKDMASSTISAVTPWCIVAPVVEYWFSNLIFVFQKHDFGFGSILNPKVEDGRE